MARNNIEQVPEIEELEPESEGSPVAPEEAEQPLVEQFPPEKLAQARLRMRDLEETLGWETDKARLLKLRGEIRDLKALIRKYSRPTLTLIEGGRSDTRPKTVKEIDATLQELSAQHAELRKRFTQIHTDKAGAAVVAEQIDVVKREIAELKAKRSEIMGRIPKRGVTAESLARMGEEFQKKLAEEREIKQEGEKRRATIKRVANEPTVPPVLRKRLAARDVIAAKKDFFAAIDAVPAQPQDELATTEAEQEFFGATEEEAHERAEAFERYEGKLAPKQAVKEKRALEARAPKSAAEAQRNLIQAIDRLHEDFPDYIAFTGREYVAALTFPPEKAGFFKKIYNKLSGTRPLVAMYDAAIEQIPANVSPIRKFIEAQRAALPRPPSGGGVKVR